MILPAALVPLRHPVFRALWIANLATGLGTWMQNTGAGWMMTSLSPDPLMVSLVQAATLLPVFLFALPAGALADIVDRRRFLLATQIWMLLAAMGLAITTALDMTTPWLLLGFTFAIGAGMAMNMPAWAATVPETVPRDDLVQALALNAIGFNLARAVGPALAGLLVAAAGAEAAFTLNAISFFGVIGVIYFWKRVPPESHLPREFFLSAVGTGIRFVAATPTMRAAIVRAVAFFAFTSAPWGLLPLVVKDRLLLGPEAYGMLLGLMGAGAVGGGFLLPFFRKHFSRSNIVLLASITSCAGILGLALVPHWSVAGISMALFGIGWICAASTAQAAAQLACPAWVRARAMGIYQLSFFGALALGSAFWGWLATAAGVPASLIVAGAVGCLVALAVRDLPLDTNPHALVTPGFSQPVPEAPAPELAAILPKSRDQVLEILRYEVNAEDRPAFLAAMVECERVRRRVGARHWRLFENVAHPELWMESWTVESWTDHLREAARLTDADRATLAHASSFHRGTNPPVAERYLNLPPQQQGWGWQNAPASPSVSRKD